MCTKSATDPSLGSRKSSDLEFLQMSCVDVDLILVKISSYFPAVVAGISRP